MLPLIRFNTPFAFFFLLFFPLSSTTDSNVNVWRGRKKSVILACLSHVVIIERWLLRLFVVSAALSEEEESGYRRLKRKDKRTAELQKQKMIGTKML